MTDWLPISQVLPPLSNQNVATPTPPSTDGTPYAPPAADLNVGPGVPPPTGPANNGLAIASLICGIMGFLCGGIFVAVPAIIMGHIARGQINREPEKFQGGGMALAGLILGYVCLAINILIIALAVFGVFDSNDFDFDFN